MRQRNCIGVSKDQKLKSNSAHRKGKGNVLKRNRFDGRLGLEKRER